MNQSITMGMMLVGHRPGSTTFDIEHQLEDAISLWRELNPVNSRSDWTQSCTGQCEAFATVLHNIFSAERDDMLFCVISRKTYDKRSRRLVSVNPFSHCVVCFGADGLFLDYDGNGLDAIPKWDEAWTDDPGERTVFDHRAFESLEQMKAHLGKRRKEGGTYRTNPVDEELVKIWTESMMQAIDMTGLTFAASTSMH